MYSSMLLNQYIYIYISISVTLYVMRLTVPLGFCCFITSGLLLFSSYFIIHILCGLISFPETFPPPSVCPPSVLPGFPPIHLFPLAVIYFMYNCMNVLFHSLLCFCLDNSAMIFFLRDVISSLGFAFSSN